MLTHRNSSNRIFVFIAIIFLLIASLACNASAENRATNTPDDSFITTDEPTTTEESSSDSDNESDDPTDTPEPDEDSDADATATECTYDAEYGSDISIPDGQIMAPDESFTKTWEIESTGCIAWLTGTELVFTSGDQMDGVTTSVISAIPGETVQVSVDMVSPSTAGIYKGYWRLQDPNGVRFGHEYYVEIEVVEPTALPVQLVAPDLTITSITPIPSTPLDNKTVNFDIVITNQGDGAAPASKLGFEAVNAGAGGTLDVDPLGVGQSQTIQAGFTFDTNDYTIRATADFNDDVEESDEANNILELAITVHDWSTYSSKQFTIQGDQCIDMDEGILTLCTTATTIDFSWHKNTGGAGTIQYWLIPKNGTTVAVFGTGTPDIVDCMLAPLSSTQIDGGQYQSSTNTYTPADMPVGTYLCYQTSEGRYGLFRVNELNDYGNALKLGYTTWQID